MFRLTLCNNIWSAVPLISNPATPVTLKLSNANRKNQYARCVARVPVQVWSRELQSFTCVNVNSFIL